MRIFLAINLPDTIRYEMEAILEEAKQANDFPGLKWTKPRSLHLTLHFLDDQGDESINKIIEICNQAAQEFKPTNVRVGEWGGFPNLIQPKIVFVSLNDSDTLINLQKFLGDKLNKQGFEIDSRPFKTHITVARNEDSQEMLALALPDIGELEWKVNSFELMKSSLLPDGAEYEVIKSFKL
jgi:2'-5' RNA ligase